MRKRETVGSGWREAHFGRAPLVAIALAVVVLAARPAGTGDSPDCTDPQSGCSLAETAAQAGFWVGAAVGNAASHPSTQATIGGHFNSMTAENAMKWGPLARRVGEYDFGRADALVGLAEERAVRMRGHTLLWGRGPLPVDLESEVNQSPNPQARLRELLDQHIRTVVGRYAGRVQSWDVVNEPLSVAGAAFDYNLFFRTLGESYIAEAFRIAHEADPGAQLFLNEFFFVYSGSPKSQAFLALVEKLVAEGVPMHGVGVQAHFWDYLPIALPSREEFQNFLQALADLGLAVELTELDISRHYFDQGPDPLLRQAEFYSEITSACVAVPACQGITTWGIDDPGTWLDVTAPFDQVAPHEPLLFDAELQPKPAYFSMRDAVAERIIPFTARALLRLFDESVKTGALEGAGPPGSAVAKLRSLRSSLEKTVKYIDSDRVSGACRELERTARRLDTDGSSRAFATGPAARDLEEAIRELRGLLACDS